VRYPQWILEHIKTHNCHLWAALTWIILRYQMLLCQPTCQ
jgi:hypothetical protein